MLPAETMLGGKYKIIGLLGSGGMGDVYEAWQTDLARPVAIKLLSGKIASDPVVFQRFRREAALLASLGHPNIVNVIEFSTEAGAPPMLVMEKLEGTSLKDVLREGGCMAPPRSVFIALQLLSALSATHRANIVHRDIKPANVFVLKTLAVPDFVKLIDFGIAKVDAAQLSRAPLTAMGEVLGTLSYMAPEQAAGAAVDGRADLFAVGCILFEAISGQRARRFDPAGGYEALFAPCRSLIEAAPFVDARLAAIVDRALDLDPERRFPSAEAMATALQSFAPPQLAEASPGGASRVVAVTSPVTSHAPTPAAPGVDSTRSSLPTRALQAALPGAVAHATQVSAAAPPEVTPLAQGAGSPAAASFRAAGFGTQLSQPATAPPLHPWVAAPAPPTMPSTMRWPAQQPALPASVARRGPSLLWLAVPLVLFGLAVAGVVLLFSDRLSSSDPPGAASAAITPAVTPPPKSPRAVPSMVPPSPPSSPEVAAPAPLGLPACDAFIEWAFHHCDSGSPQNRQMWRGIARDYRDRFAKVSRASWPEIAKSCKEMQLKFQENQPSCK